MYRASYDDDYDDDDTPHTTPTPTGPNPFWALSISQDNHWRQRGLYSHHPLCNCARRSTFF